MIKYKKKNETHSQTEMSREDKLEANIKRKTRLIKRLRHDALAKTAGSAAALIIMFSFVFGIAVVPTNDMYPAIRDGDLVVYFRPGRVIDTDVVIYEAPDGSTHIGRVEGTHGESVGVTDGGLLTINGNIQPVQKRRGLYDETYAGDTDISGEIGSGEYLILGDRRETAEDSRVFGLIARRSIKGKAFTIVRRRAL